MTELVVKSQLDLSLARVQLAHLHDDGPGENTVRHEECFWVDMCLTPRRPDERARYVDRWGPHRFTRLGSIIALPPRETLQLTTVGGRRTSLICQLQASAVQKWLPDDFELTDRRLEVCLDIANATIRSLLLRLAHEMHSPGRGSRELAEAITCLFAIEFARYLAAVSEPMENGGLASWRLRLVDQRLAAPGLPPTLEELADLCNLSKRQLTRAFRTSRGCSIGDHLAQSRIEVAKRRLAAGESIKSITSSMGFSSQSTFAHAFRRATGVTPTLFRRRLVRGGQGVQPQ